MTSTKIRDLETVVFELPFVRPHKLAMTTITAQASVLVRLRSEDGLEGIGQATVLGGPAYSAETPAGMKRIINECFAPLLAGQDIAWRAQLRSRMDSAVVGNHYAKAAVDMALVDLHARLLGISAAELLGGRLHDSFRLLWVLGTGDANCDVDEAEAKLEQRLHDLFLVKIGRGDPAADIDRVAKIQAAIGDRAELRVDVNQAWTERQARWACRALAQAGVTVVEQPVAQQRHDALRRLTADGHVTVLADESVRTAEDAFALARDHSVDAVSLKLVKHGGIGPTQRIATIAQTAGLELFGGGMIEPTLEIAASALTFSTLPELSLDCQLFGPMLFADDITTTRPEMRDFRIWVPDGVGFGVDIDEDKLAYHRQDR